MAQFDVHRNCGRNRAAIPFVVVVQSALYDGYRRRVVVPLVRRDHLAGIVPGRLNPVFSVEGVELLLHPLEIVSVAVADLGEYVTSLAMHGDTVGQALDELLTQAWH